MSSLQQTNSEKTLLSWVRHCTRGRSDVNVLNFTTSWTDGLAFNAILHHFRSHTHTHTLFSLYYLLGFVSSTFLPSKHLVSSHFVIFFYLLMFLLFRFFFFFSFLLFLHAFLYSLFSPVRMSPCFVFSLYFVLFYLISHLFMSHLFFSFVSCPFWTHISSPFVSRPHAFSWDQIVALSPVERLEHAFSFAKNELNIEKLLDPEGKNHLQFPHMGHVTNQRVHTHYTHTPYTPHTSYIS